MLVTVDRGDTYDERADGMHAGGRRGDRRR